jgi:hypothetical protein
MGMEKVGLPHVGKGFFWLWNLKLLTFLTFAFKNANPQIMDSFGPKHA